MRLTLITTHAIESANSLGMNGTPEDMLISLIEDQVRNNFNMAIKVKQGGKDRWIIPAVMPRSIWCESMCCWIVLSVPTDEKTIAKFKYVARTLLHENSPVVRKLWRHEGVENPVRGYMKYLKEMKELK